MGLHTASTVRDAWKGEHERMRAEAKDFAQRAKDLRRDAFLHRRYRRWLEALIADGRAREMRDASLQRKAEATKIKKQWGFR